MRRLRSRRNRKTRLKSNSVATGTPTPVPTARSFRDGCAGPDDSSSGVIVRVGVFAGSDGLDDVRDASELGDVVMDEDEEVRV